MREPDAIARILATIPDEIRFRAPRESGQTEAPKPEPKGVAVQPIQPSLFEMETKDGQ